jgi:hypothetical protein
LWLNVLVSIVDNIFQVSFVKELAVFGIEVNGANQEDQPIMQIKGQKDFVHDA